MLSRSKLWVVLLCVMMVLCASVAEASHVHPDEQGSRPASKKTTSACVICHISHSPAVSVSVVLLEQAHSAGLFLSSFTATSRTRFQAFGLYVRPPPVTC
jgi:hypothetical protein